MTLDVLLASAADVAVAVAPAADIAIPPDAVDDGLAIVGGDGSYVDNAGVIDRNQPYHNGTQRLNCSTSQVPSNAQLPH